MSNFGQGNMDRYRGGGAQEISERGKYAKMQEYRPPVSGGKGQARSPTSEYQEWKEISDLALSVRQEVGFQPDTRRADNDKDSLSFIAKRALEDIQRMNKALSEEMNKLRENIEMYSTEPTQQQEQQQRCDKTQPPNRIRQQPQATNKTKKEKDQSEDKKDHKSSQDDTNLEIITKAVSSFCDLQQYKSKMDHLAKRTIQLAMKEGDQPITDKTLLSQFEIAIEDIEDDFKKLRHLETQNSTMDHLAKRAIQLAKKEGDQPIQDKALLSQLERAIKDIEVDFKKLRQLETKNRDEIQKLKREIEIKVKEKEALHNRLSKLAGNKMTEDIPNIANLGDPNRPTKIAEIYSEIYDNDWTDALDFCQKKLRNEYREDDALQALNKTLIICYKICQEKSDQWVEKTKGVLKRCSDELVVDIQGEEFLTQIIEGRRAVSDQMSKQFLKEIRPKKDLQVTKYAKEMNSKLYKMIIQNKFFEKCFTLCWKMIVQNPRMILVEGPPRGNTYDRTVFREFTSSGFKVVFTVWPALYLHEGGPLLVKGVVKVE